MGGPSDRESGYFKLSLEYSKDIDPWELLARLVSELGKLIQRPPPNYRAGWRRNERYALSYSTDVATTVCDLWKYLHRPPGLSESGAIPLGIATAVDVLGELVDKWVDRWKIHVHARTSCDLWSPRFGAGGGDILRAGALAVDVGPPFIDVQPDESELLHWVFQKLKEEVRSANPPEVPAPGDRPVTVPPVTSAGEDSRTLESQTSQRPVAEIDYDKLADDIGGLCGKLIRFMKDKTGASHQDIYENVYDGSSRAWNTIKTLVCRTNNKILEAMRKPKFKRGPRLFFKGFDLGLM
jgi:hypothetical protein